MRSMIKLVRVPVCLRRAGRRSAAAWFAGLTIWYFGRDLPDYQQLADYQPPIVTRVYAGDGRLLAEYATEKRVFVPIERDAAAGDPRLPRGRGQEFLLPSRRRSDRRCCARRSPISAHWQQQPAAGRRLDDHAAGRQELPADQRGLARAQDQGGADRHRAWSEALPQGPHPRALSQRDLSRRRRLWRRGGGAELFQQVARRADARRGGVSRRRCPRRRTTTIRCAIPRRRRTRRDWVHRPHGRGRLRDRGAGRGREGRAARRCASARRPRASTPTISPKRCAASCSRATARRRSTRAGLSVRTSLDPRAPGGRRQGAARRAHRL